MGELSGKVAFVTGAAHGQGRATAVALAREGAAVLGFDIARPLPYPGYGMGVVSPAARSATLVFHNSLPVAASTATVCPSSRL